VRESTIDLKAFCQASFAKTMLPVMQETNPAILCLPLHGLKSVKFPLNKLGNKVIFRNKRWKLDSGDREYEARHALFR